MEFSGKNHKITSQSDSEKNQHVSFSKDWTLQEHDNSFNTLKDKFWYNVFEIMTSKLYIIFFEKKKVSIQPYTFVGTNGSFKRYM
jgi:hypothetical protein